MGEHKCEQEIRAEAVFVSTTDAASRIRRVFKILITATADSDPRQTATNLEDGIPVKKAGRHDDDNVTESKI